MAKVLKVAFGLGVTGVFLWLVFRQISFAEVRGTIAEADPGWIVAAVGLFFLGYAARIQRWRLMLRHENPDLGWRRSAVPFLGSIAVNNLVPLRAGDALRAFAFTDWLGVSASAALATVLVERILDLLVLLLALALALMLLPTSSADLVAMLGVGAQGIVVAVLIALFVLLFPKVFEPLAIAAPRILARWKPELGERAGAAIVRVFDTLEHLSGHGVMFRLVLWSLVAWAFEASVFWCVAVAIEPVQDPMAGLVAMPVGTLSTLVPSSPGYVGTFDFFVAKTIELMGNTFSTGAAYAVTVHMVLWLAATLAGGICLLIWVFRRGGDVPADDEGQENE